MAMQLLDMNEDWKLANKLRIEDSEQFYTLVQMHLSFILEFNFKERDCLVEKKFKIKSFKKKDKCSVKGVMDGAPITQEGVCQAYQLIEFLSQEENVMQVGIFRKNGSIIRQQKLKTLLNQGQTIDFYNGKFTVHDCATVLKSFLAEQPEPIMMETFYPAYCQISEFCQKMEIHNNSERSLRALQYLLLLLPIDNLVLLKDIIKLLHFTALHSEKNRMPQDNLATLFTGHLIVPRKLPAEELHPVTQNLSHIVIYMIKLGLDLFKIPPNLSVDIRAYWSKKTLQPDKEEGTITMTVFSFTDRSTKENEENHTVKALAELHAHIQNLPESDKNRRMFIKRVSNQNSVITRNLTKMTAADIRISAEL